MTSRGSRPSDRRIANVREITGLRFLPEHAPATLVNMSRTGLLAESALRCRVGADVTLSFEGGFEPGTVTGRVARCEVAVMGPDGLLRYHVGIEFDAPLEFDDDEETQEIAAPVVRPAAARNRW